MSDLSHFALDLALDTKAFVQSYVAKALVGITDRFTALEQQIAGVTTRPGPAGDRGETGPAGPPGRDGVDADPLRLKAEMTADLREQLRAEMAAMMREMVREEVRHAMAGVRMPVDGRDGKDADVEMVKAFVDASVQAHRQPVPDVDGIVHAAVTKAFATVRQPRDGIDGKDGTPGAAGRDGLDGHPGKDGVSVTLDEVRPFIADEIRRTVAALPPAKDGRDGLPGVPGPQGERGADGKDGLNGKDGAAGLNGKDGTTFTEFGLTIDDDAGPIVHLKSTDGSLDAPWPGMWDAGVWRAGKHYPRGAGVSWNGSIWIAQVNTKGEKPGDGSGVWRLAVKAGRDFKPPRE